jgi:hypothetical protein
VEWDRVNGGDHANAIAGFSKDPIRSIGIVPFPGLAVVVGEGLAPYGPLGVGLVPSEYDDHGSSYLVVFAKEQSDAASERTHYGRIYSAAIAVHPVEPPELGLGIEGADRSAFVYFAIAQLAADHVEIAVALECGEIFHGRFEFCIFLTIGEAGVEVFVFHRPFSDQVVEIGIGRCWGGGDDQFSFGVKFKCWQRKAVDRLGVPGMDQGQQQQDGAAAHCENRYMFHG